MRTRPDRPHTHAALAAAVLVPLVTLALYLSFGSPGMPAFPASARNEVPPDRAGVAELVARVEARLREHPEEGEGWRAIAPVYFKLGRYGDAANAYARAMQLKGDSLELLEGFVDAGMLASDGVVTEEVRRACEKILALDPARQEARFWLALAKEQDGKLADALSDYRSLLTKAPADAPWRAALGERIDDVTRRLTPGSKPADPGPTTADVAAAQSLSAEERGRMIAGMVDGLAQRLKQNGRDLSGWRRLVNAYVVLDRRDDARQALAEARRNFAGDEGALSELAALAARLGLGS